MAKGNAAEQAREQAVITLGSGKSIDLLAPRREDVELEVIAHALSQINRFTGHTRRPYSVAEHCVLGLQLVKPFAALDWLLHDAPEAFLGDVSSPLKAILGPMYPILEERWATVIADVFGLSTDGVVIDEVKRVDRRMLLIEQRSLIGPKSPMDISSLEEFCYPEEYAMFHLLRRGSQRVDASEPFVASARKLMAERYLLAQVSA